MYNINKHQDVSFIEKCAVLFGYTKLTEYAAEAKKNGIGNYLDHAVLRCIKEGFLTDYLKKNSTEVRNMLIAEYSYEDDMRVQWNGGYEQGIAQQKAEDEKILARVTTQKDAEIEALKKQLALARAGR